MKRILPFAALFFAAILNAQHVTDTSTSKPLPAPAAPVVNINTASDVQLAYLPRVGKVLAGRVVDYRMQHGQFRFASDLTQVKGFGEKLFARVNPFVVLSGATTATRKIHSSEVRP